MIYLSSKEINHLRINPQMIMKRFEIMRIEIISHNRASWASWASQPCNGGIIGLVWA